MSLGMTEVLLILGIALLFFGPSKLPGLGKSIGEAIRGFKKGINGDEVDVTPVDASSSRAAADAKLHQAASQQSASQAQTQDAETETTKSK